VILASKAGERHLSNREVFEELRDRAFPVLDDGHVILVDATGDDQAIVDAARVSYGKGTKRASEDRDLIRYLLRNAHTTPFEMAEIKIRIRAPMDVMRQWIRHRTASVNEYSTRYSEAIDSAQKTAPDAWRLQSAMNKQGSGDVLANWTGPDGKPNPDNESPEWALDHEARLIGKIPMDRPLSPGDALSIVEADFHRQARRVYEQRLAMGIAREQARKDLPLSTYTELYWKNDLWNTLNFLRLRMDSHAQLEIRSYANVIGNEIVAKLFPVAWEAFQDYVHGAVKLSRLDVEAIRKLVGPGNGTGARPAVADALEHVANKREREECRLKLASLGLINGAEA
jgi:thymidylate synthase (FAD)